MVTKLKVNGRIKCDTYFPDPELSSELLLIDDEISVKYIGIKKPNHFYEVRTFEVHDARTGQNHTVEHFWVSLSTLTPA